RRGDLGVEARRLLRQRPVPPTDEQHGGDDDQAAADGELLPDRYRERLLLDLRRPRGAEEVDPDHRSPAFLSARPTATAAAGATPDTSEIPIFAPSQAIFRKGSNTSTGVPKRSCRASANPSTFDAPPLTTIRSIWSDDALAL